MTRPHSGAMNLKKQGWCHTNAAYPDISPKKLVGDGDRKRCLSPYFRPTLWAVKPPGNAVTCRKFIGKSGSKAQTRLLATVSDDEDTDDLVLSGLGMPPRKVAQRILCVRAVNLPRGVKQSPRSISLVLY
jgi:hypothetical protein